MQLHPVPDGVLDRPHGRLGLGARCLFTPEEPHHGQIAEPGVVDPVARVGPFHDDGAILDWLPAETGAVVRVPLRATSAFITRSKEKLSSLRDFLDTLVDDSDPAENAHLGFIVLGIFALTLQNGIDAKAMIARHVEEQRLARVVFENEGVLSLRRGRTIVHDPVALGRYLIAAPGFVAALVVTRGIPGLDRRDHLQVRDRHYVQLRTCADHRHGQRRV